MLKYVVIFAVGLLSSCSTEKEWSPESLGSTLATLKEEKKINYDPQNKPEENARFNFEDKTSDYGLDDLDASSIMAVDFNFDGFPDLALIKDYFSQPEFYFFNPKTSKFEKQSSIFDTRLKASFVLFHDFTGDKVIDALMGVLNQGSEVSERPLVLLKGYKTKSGLRFKEVPRAFTLKPGPTATVGAIDFDLDGDLDLFVGNWFKKEKGTSIPQKDYLLENINGKFVDASDLLKGEQARNSQDTMNVNATPTFSSQICDMDLNGFPDILTASTNGYQNKLWMNSYKTRANKRHFENHAVASYFAGDPEGMLNSMGGGRTFSVACADYNHDGIMDAFMGEVSHNHDTDSTDKSSILTGSTRKFPPKYIRTEYVLDAHDLKWNQSDKRGIWVDFDNDGLQDLWVDNSGYPPHTRSLLFVQHPDHSFENLAKESGVDFVNPNSTIILDINKDGKLDILSNRTNLRDARIRKRLFLFVNNSKNENRSLKFLLRGRKANFQGLNATVELRIKVANGLVRRIRQVSYSYGGLNPQNEEGVHFGLKKGEEPVSVKVIWPYSKTLNSGRAGLEKFYNLKGKLNFDHRLEITLCEVGTYSVGRKECPDL